MAHGAKATGILFLAGFVYLSAHSAIWGRGLSGSGTAFVTSDAPPDLPRTDIQMKAAAGHLREELELAADYLSGRGGVTRDLSQAAYWYRKAADQGDTVAEVQIGYFYLAGIGLNRDAEQAARWFHRASASGSSMGKLNLAVLYLKGVGVAKDARLGLELLDELAKHDDPRGEAYLGFLYVLGIGVGRDPVTAEHWFAKAAKHHNPEAEYGMGTLYTGAEGHGRDLDRAAAYLRQSADAGYVPAKHSLGLLLVNHPEIPQAPGEATSLLEAAATAGKWRSSATLGILYREGKIVPKDISAAYRWFTIAESQGGDEAKVPLRADLAAARSALSIEEQKQSENLATRWLAANPHTDVFLLKNSGSEFFPLNEVYATELAQNIREREQGIH